MTNQTTIQLATLDKATRWGEEWISADLDLVKACDDVPAVELAAALGRTLYAVYSVRKAIRTGRPIGGGGRNQATHGRVRGGQRWIAVDDLV